MSPFPKTPASFEKLILKQARALKIQDREGRIGGIPVETAIYEKPFLKESDFDKAFWPWRRVSVECIKLLLMLSIEFGARCQKRDCDDHVRALYSLSAKSAQDLQAFLLLLSRGFGAQAMAMGRCTTESLEALGYFSLHAEVAREFVRAKTPDEANSFWHRSMSKGKIRKTVVRELREVFGEIYDHQGDWLAERRSLLGAAVHPWYTAFALPLATDGLENEPWMPGLTMATKTDLLNVPPVLVAVVEMILMLAKSEFCCPNTHQLLLCDESKVSGEPEESYIRRGHLLVAQLVSYLMLSAMKPEVAAQPWTVAAGNARGTYA